MKTPIAIHNLWHQGAKTVVSIGGVAFALLLVFMQLGFMGAVSRTATNVLERLRFDIVLRAHDYVHLYEPGRIDRKWLSVAQGTDGVSAAKPFWLTIQNWQTLPTQLESEDSAVAFESQYLPIAVMAFQPDALVFELEDVVEQQGRLKLDSALLIDYGTHDDYGPWSGKRFSQTDVDMGRSTEIFRQQFRIAGIYDLGTGLAANGAVMMGDEGFQRIWPWSTEQSCCLGLIEVADKDPANIERIAAEIRKRTHGDTTEHEDANSFWTTVRTLMGAPKPTTSSGAVEVLTKHETQQREKYRWLWQTPIGLIFQLGVVLALIVGAAIVYMILSTDVANRLPEYATLLAMGYSRKYLASIVMTQAIVLCVFGFLASWVIAEVLYRVTYALSNLPLVMEPSRVVVVFVLGLVMCCVSGLLALRKLWKAEPASLF